MRYVTFMARSDSGRVVIVLDPELKEELYSGLKEDGSNLKAWFLERASAYIEGKRQPSLFGDQSTMHKSQNDFKLRPKKERSSSP